MLRLSVVIPTYNRAAFLVEALGSVARQTVPSHEVIVVDDASTDNTEKQVRAFSLLGSRLVYHRLPENRGAAVSRNVGVELAQGEVVSFLDSDDLLEPIHHARAIEVLEERPETALFSCDALLIDDAGRRLRGGRTYWEVQCAIKGMSLSSGTRELTDVFLVSTLFVGCTVRREVFRRVGGLCQQLFPLEDYDFTLRVAGEGHRIYYEHSPLGRYRMHGDNSSGPRQGVFVQKQRLRCLVRALERSEELRLLGRRGRTRIGEVRRELALAHLKAHQPLDGMIQLSRSIAEDPSGIADLIRIARRKAHRRPPEYL